MATVKEYLEVHRGEIGCTQCGNCCKNSCEAKIVHKKESTTSCKYHPTVTGYLEGSLKDQRTRSPLCALCPEDIFVELHVACPPVLDTIEKLTGEAVSFHPSQRFPGIVMVRSDVIERVLETEIRLEL